MNEDKASRYHRLEAHGARGARVGRWRRSSSSCSRRGVGAGGVVACAGARRRRRWPRCRPARPLAVAARSTSPAWRCVLEAAALAAGLVSRPRARAPLRPVDACRCGRGGAITPRAAAARPRSSAGRQRRSSYASMAWWPARLVGGRRRCVFAGASLAADAGWRRSCSCRCSSRSARCTRAALAARLAALAQRAGVPVARRLRVAARRPHARGERRAGGHGPRRGASSLSDTLLAHVLRRRDRGDPRARTGAPRAPRPAGGRSALEARADRWRRCCAGHRRRCARPSAGTSASRAWTTSPALPLLLLAAGAWRLVTTPLRQRACPARHERRADRFALDLTEQPRRVRRRRCAGSAPRTSPRSAVAARRGWLFHSHPPVDERIVAAQAWDGDRGR